MLGMITLHDYFGQRIFSPDYTPELGKSAGYLLECVNDLMAHYEAQTGFELAINPKTNSHISGTTEGGFRLHDCPQGSAKSSHKVAEGIDIYDPLDRLDEFIDLNPALLVTFNLYREHPKSTPSWVHLTIRPPRSKLRTFYP